MRFLTSTLLVLLVSGTVVGQSTPTDPAVEMLKNSYLENEKANLLDYLKKRTQKTADAKAIEKLIADLDAKDAATGDKACVELIKMGMTAVPALRKAVNNVASAEATRRAKKCLESINSPELTQAVIRLLGSKDPKGTIKALFDFAPFAEDNDVEEILSQTIERLSAQDGKLPTELTDALKSESPIQRAIAAEIIANIGTRADFSTLHPLLKDEKPTVRYRVAMALAERYDPQAVPTLIDLLEELPQEQKVKCEEYLTQLAGQWKLSVGAGDDAFSRQLREAVWTAWWKALSSDKLVAILQERTPTLEEKKEIEGLIKKLGASSADDREAATNNLLKYGIKAMAQLREASGDENNIGRGAARVMVLIEREGSFQELPMAVVRVLGMQSSLEAVQALLGFLPYAPTPEMKDTIQEVLPAVAARAENSKDFLVKALTDPMKERRLAAVHTLASLPAHQDEVKQALSSEDPSMRFRAAMSLANARDKSAIPTLIKLLADAPVNDAWRIEEYLLRIAGSAHPKVSLSSAGSNRKPVSEAWAKWWDANKDSVALIPVRDSQHLLGYTLVIEYYNSRTSRGRVMELDRAGKIRWEIQGLNYPYDAQFLGHNRIAIAEQNMNRVTIRDLKGKELSQIQVQQPFVTQKLSNGSLFIAGRYHLVVADRKGNKSYERRVNDYLMAATRLKNGDFAYVTNSYVYKRLDSKGAVKKTFTLPNSPRGGSRYVEMLPNGNVLQALYSERKVMEVDPNGKVVWEAKDIERPNLATRLPNGHTLVCSRNAHKVTELDRTGKVVKTFHDNSFYPWKAYKR